MCIYGRFNIFRLLVFCFLWDGRFFFGLDASSITSLVFLLISLASAIIVVPLRDYKLDKVFGYWLIFVYIVYTISELTLLIFEEEEGVL